MEWFVVITNGVRICVCAQTVEDAIQCAAVHLAAVLGSPSVTDIREIRRMA